MMKNTILGTREACAGGCRAPPATLRSLSPQSCSHTRWVMALPGPQPATLPPGIPSGHNTLRRVTPASAPSPRQRTQVSGHPLAPRHPPRHPSRHPPCHPPCQRRTLDPGAGLTPPPAPTAACMPRPLHALSWVGASGVCWATLGTSFRGWDQTEGAGDLLWGAAPHSGPSPRVPQRGRQEGRRGGGVGRSRVRRAPESSQSRSARAVPGGPRAGVSHHGAGGDESPKGRRGGGGRGDAGWGTRGQCGADPRRWGRRGLVSRGPGVRGGQGAALSRIIPVRGLWPPRHGGFAAQATLRLQEPNWLKSLMRDLLPSVLLCPWWVPRWGPPKSALV